MDLAKNGENGSRSCKSAVGKEKAAEEGGKPRAKIQLTPSRTNGFCLGIMRHTCDKPHAFLCDNQALLKAV